MIPLKASLVALALTTAGAAFAQTPYSTPMRDVENPDRFPYMENAAGALTPPFVNGFLQFATPLGRRIVLEQVTVSCTTPSATDTITAVYVITRKNVTSGSIGYSAPAVQMSRRGTAAFGGYLWTGHTQVKMYGDPDLFSPDGGKAISLNIFHTDTTVTATCTGFISGHTVGL